MKEGDALMQLGLARVECGPGSRGSNPWPKKRSTLLETMPPGPELAAAYSARSFICMLARDADGALAWGHKGHRSRPPGRRRRTAGARVERRGLDRDRAARAPDGIAKLEESRAFGGRGGPGRTGLQRLHEPGKRVRERSATTPRRSATWRRGSRTTLSAIWTERRDTIPRGWRECDSSRGDGPRPVISLRRFQSAPMSPRSARSWR